MDAWLKEIQEMINRDRKSTDDLPECIKYVSERVDSYSTVRQLCDTSPKNEFELTTIPAGNDSPITYMEAPGWILPKMGYVAMDYIEMCANSLLIPIFSISGGKNWINKYNEAGRTDVWQRALDSIANTILCYEQEAFFRTVIPAVTSSFKGVEGLFPSYEAPIVRGGNKCTLSLISQMANLLYSRGKELGYVMISPEDLEDLNTVPLGKDSYSGNYICYVSPYPIKNIADTDKLKRVEIIVNDNLGLKGKYNINDREAEYGPFKGSCDQNMYSDYKIMNGSVNDDNGYVVKGGETQIYGFSADIKDSMKMPITEVHIFQDTGSGLADSGKTGILFVQKMGSACLNPKCLVMGIIDRGLQDA